MKRTLTLVLAAALLAMPMVRPGIASAHAPHAKATLIVWEDLDPKSPQIAQLNALAKKWGDANGATVTFVGLAQPGRGGTSIVDAFPLKAKSASGPDVIYAPEDQTGAFVASGLVDPRPASLLSTAEMDMFKASPLNAFNVNGVAYGIPNGIDGTMLFYNKKLVPTAPKTWTQLISIAKSLRHGNQYGLIFPIANFYFSYFAFGGYGAPVFKTVNGKPDANNLGLGGPAGEAALTFLGSLIGPKLMPKSADYAPMASNFTAGRCGMAITGPWEFTNFSTALGKNLGIASLPTLPNGKPSTPFIGVRGWEVNAFSQHKSLAWSLAKYLTFHDEVLTANVEGRLPVFKSVPGLTLNWMQKAAVTQFDFGVPMPNIPEMGQVWTPMNNALTLVVQGRSTPAKALAAAVLQIKAGIAKMHQ